MPRQGDHDRFPPERLINDARIGNRKPNETHIDASVDQCLALLHRPQILQSQLDVRKTLTESSDHVRQWSVGGGGHVADGQLPHFATLGALCGADGPLGLRMPVFIQPSGTRQTSFPILPTDKVLYVGQPVAAVIAENRYIAEDALERMHVAWEPLPVVVDVDEAMSSGAARLHEDWPDNVAGRRDILTGDPDRAFASAHAVVEATFTMPRHAAAPLEGRAALASFDRDTGELSVWASSQAPHLYRTVLADTLGIEENRVAVIVPDVGGGFGVKLHYYPEDMLVALAAMRLGRPVKWIETRSENLASTVHARQQRIRARAAFGSDGTLLAVEAHVRGDVGAHLHTKGPAPIFTTGVILPGPYRVAHYRARIEAIVTNKTPFGAYRAFGQQQATFVTERLMDMGARRLGLDPAEIRRRNFIPPDAFPFRSAGGWEYDSGRYADGLARALDSARHDELRAWQASERARGRAIGLGLSCYIEFTGMGPSRIMAAMGNRQGGYETAVVRVDPSGHATITSGIIEIGQGIRSAMAQIAAEVLGLPYEHVRVVLGHTAVTPYSAYGTAGSRGAVVAGGSVLEASRRVKEKAVRIAAASPGSGAGRHRGRGRTLRRARRAVTRADARGDRARGASWPAAARRQRARARGALRPRAEELDVLVGRPPGFGRGRLRNRCRARPRLLDRARLR